MDQISERSTRSNIRANEIIESDQLAAVTPRLSSLRSDQKIKGGLDIQTTNPTQGVFFDEDFMYRIQTIGKEARELHDKYRVLSGGARKTTSSSKKSLKRKSSEKKSSKRSAKPDIVISSSKPNLPEGLIY